MLATLLFKGCGAPGRSIRTHNRVSRNDSTKLTVEVGDVNGVNIFSHTWIQCEILRFVRIGLEIEQFDVVELENALERSRYVDDPGER
jgi:hypothetical protein